MEAFRYKALDASGRTVSGVVQAETARQARAQLRAQGLLPSSLTSVRTGAQPLFSWRREISPAGLSMLTRQLSVLLGSGLTMEQALTALIDETGEGKTKDMLSGVKAEVVAGFSLSSALGNYEKSFPDFYRALVHGGEESGALATVLQHLADYLDARQALKQKTGLALLYPILVTVVAIAIVSGLLIYVVPQVVQVFQQSHQKLPLLTRSLIVVSNALRASWPYLIVMMIIAGFGARMALRRETVRYRWHTLLLRIPAVGPLIRSTNTAQFASTLSILMGGGVPLISALKSSARVMNNLVLREAADLAIARVSEGASLARALSASAQFPPLLNHLIASGELSGKLEQMLKRAAELETQGLERRLSVFVTLLEPLMILFMGGVVLLIVLAILLPIIEINQLVH